MNTRRLRDIEVSSIGMGCMGMSHGYGEIPDQGYSIEAIRNFNRDLEKKQMKQKRNFLSILIIALNVIGIMCLIYFAIPYLTHNVIITNPDAMLPAEAWDNAGMALTVGFIPLLIANMLCFVFVKAKQKSVSFLYFIPSVVCLLIVLSYWIPALG